MTAKVLLVVVCGLALVLATVIALRWGSLRREPPAPLPRDATSKVVAARWLRTACIGVVGGAIAGVLVAGLGGRLVMRILAATSGAGVQGIKTEAEEVVGEVTLGGTFFLVLFAGALGALLGVLFVAVRRWLPERAWFAGLVFGLVGIALVRPLQLLDPGSIDFDIVRPLALAVPLLVAIPLFYGIVVASAVEGLDRRYPALARRPRAIAAYLPLLLPFFAPPLGVGLLLLGAIALGLRRLGPVARMVSGSAVMWIGRAAMALAALAGTAWVGLGAVEILTG
jgi:hypothetical protein